MNLLQVIAASDEGAKRKDILDGGSEYYKSPLRSQETKSSLKEFNFCVSMHHYIWAY